MTQKQNWEAELEHLNGKVAEQGEICQRAAELVKHCEEKRELALLANPINKLRQRLQPGEPCQVCGSTDHSFVHIAESEDEDLLQSAENALENAKTDAKTAQDQMQDFRTKHAQLQQDKRNVTAQIDECTDEIEGLRDETSRVLEQWQEIYLDNDISSDWTTEQIEKADTAIAALAEAKQAQTAASHAYEIVAPAT